MDYPLNILFPGPPKIRFLSFSFEQYSFNILFESIGLQLIAAAPKLQFDDYLQLLQSYDFQDFNFSLQLLEIKVPSFSFLICKFFFAAPPASRWSWKQNLCRTALSTALSRLVPSMFMMTMMMTSMMMAMTMMTVNSFDVTLTIAITNSIAVAVGVDINIIMIDYITDTNM